jgi:hypothetical protein
MLMVAALATDNLSEVGDATSILVSAQRIPTQATKSIMPGVKNVHEAISRAIGSDLSEDRIKKVVVNRLRLSATVYTVDAPDRPLLFLSNKKGGGNFSLEAGFHGDTFFELRQLLSQDTPLTDAQKRLAKNRMDRLDEYVAKSRKI